MSSLKQKFALNDVVKFTKGRMSGYTGAVVAFDRFYTGYPLVALHKQNPKCPGHTGASADRNHGKSNCWYIDGVNPAVLFNAKPKRTYKSAKVKPSQNDMVLDHIRKIGSISFAEAWDAYGVRSLPRRIADLKERGHNIVVKMKEHPITGQRYARYSMAA